MDGLDETGTAEYPPEPEELGPEEQESEEWDDREPDDSYTSGSARMYFAFGVWAIAFVLSFALAPTLLLKIGVNLLVSGIATSFLLTYVPEVTGLVTLNAFTGELHVFGPGLHFKYPWDVVREENFISLELVTKQHTETYAALDGPLMEATWSYQYCPSLRRLAAHIKVDATTIDAGFVDVFSSAMSELIGSMPGEEARRNVGAIEEHILDDFEKERYRHRRGPQSGRDKLEDLYGVNFKIFKLPDIDFDQEYQLARAGQARMDVVLEAARRLEGLSEGGTPTLRSVQTVLTEQGKADMNIVDTWGEADPLQRAAATHGAMTRGGN